MKREPQETSPFAELTFSQQQERWRRWRSMQLEYKKAAPEDALQEEPKQEPKPPIAPPAPSRHRELDRVLQRHQAALKKTGAFQFTSGNGRSDK